MSSPNNHTGVLKDFDSISNKGQYKDEQIKSAHFVGAPNGFATAASPIKNSGNLNITSVLSNLRLIANIPVGSKIAIRNNEIIIHDKSNWMDWASRVYNNDSRTASTYYLDEFLKDIQKLLNDGNIEYPVKQRICAQLSACPKGLDHLKNTYYDDVSTRTKIETIIENINTICSNSYEDVSNI